MGFLDDIKAKIFGTPASAAIPVAAAKPAAAPASSPAAPAAATAPTAAPSPQQAPANAGQPAPAGTAPAPSASPVAATQVDVAAILDAAVAASGQTLNWKTSIVDLLKAIGVDSSLTARKELADELGYSGDKSDSATMNIWLHKQVLAQMAANGGKVPDTLLD